MSSPVKEEQPAQPAATALAKSDSGHAPDTPKVESKDVTTVADSLPQQLTPLTEENFREATLQACEHYLAKFGGPVQYLKHHLGSNGNPKWTKFAEQLSDMFPRRPDLAYLDTLKLPRSEDPTDTFKVSLWQLGFLDACSTKPPTFKVAAAALLDEYVTNCVLTAGEPLMLYQQPEHLPTSFQCEDQSHGPVFFTHYVKGAARASSILMLAHVLLNQLNADVRLLHPNLHASMSVIYCRLATAASDAATIAMENARYSARGSIRKSHDVVTWASKLSNLRAQGLQPAEIIKRFNETATKEASIQGAKRTCLLQLLDLPPQCLTLLINHISEYSFEGSAFTETAFSKKTFMPGHQPRANNDKAWQKRLRVTNEGFELFLRYVDAAHARKPMNLRTKLDATALGEALQMSQLLISLLQEVNDQHAVSEEARAKIILPFLHGNNNLELELQSAASEMSKTFQPADITPFKELISTCIAKRDGKMEALGKGPKISAGQLEKQTFDLLLSSLQHDADCFAVWKAKCTDRDSALYFQRLNHKTARHSRAREMAESVISEDRGVGWMCELAKWEVKEATNVAVHSEVCAQIAKQCQLPNAKQVRSLCILNWAAPSVFSGATQNKQAMLLGMIVNGSSKSTAVVLTPSYFYKKGSLYKTVENANKLLATSQVICDTTFGVAFTNRNDDRQKRSLLQTGCIAMPADAKESETTWQFWKNTELFQKNLVQNAELPLSSELVQIEDLSDLALPNSTDSTTHPNQAEKFQQIGQDAAKKILTAALTNLGSEAERTALLIVDLSSRTLEFAKATCEVKKTVSTPLYYLGLTESDSELEWQRFHLATFLSDQFLQGTLPYPAGAPPLGPEELPADLVTAVPNKPDLGTLTWCNKKQDGLPSLKTPDKVLQAWHDHPEFGPQLQEWLKKHRAKLPLDLPDDGKNKRPSSSGQAQTTEASESGPGPGQAASVEPPPAKRLRSVTNLPSLALADLPTPLSWSAQIPLPATTKKAGGKCQVMIAVGKKVFLANEGSGDVEFNAGATVAGYWKGKWVMQKEGDSAESVREADVLYQLQDAHDKVILDGKVTTLAQVIKDKRAISPLDVKVLYHDLTDKPTPEDGTFFELKLKNQVLFRPENIPVKDEKKSADGSVILSYTSLADCIETKIWSNLATEILWSVKWTARGLSPVRPHICLKEALVVKAGHAVSFQPL